MIDDLDIRRAAHLLIQQRGGGAIAYAEQWIRALKEVGNIEGVQRLQEVVRAIEELSDGGAIKQRLHTPPRLRNEEGAKLGRG